MDRRFVRAGAEGAGETKRYWTESIWAIITCVAVALVPFFTEAIQFVIGAIIMQNIAGARRELFETREMLTNPRKDRRQ